MNSGTINNRAGATFDITSAYVYPVTNGSGINTFNNAGTVNKLGSSAATLDTTTFNNVGTVNVQGGTLTLRSSGTDSGAYSIASGATLETMIGARR